MAITSSESYLYITQIIATLEARLIRWPLFTFKMSRLAIKNLKKSRLFSGSRYKVAVINHIECI